MGGEAVPFYSRPGIAHLLTGVIPERLLLATGSRAILPELPGIGLPGVVTLDSYERTREIIRLAA